MKKILSFLYFIVLPFMVKSQTCSTTVVYDMVEVYNWSSGWNTPSNTGYYNNASVSPNLSAVLVGNGNGSSVIESANYILPNVTGLNPTYSYKLSFRLASYRFSNSTAATAGVDGADYVDVRYSTNAGVSYVTEMRIAGNANAYWNYNTLGVASKTANGVMTAYAPTAGGDRTTTGDGYSVIELTIPAGPTQLAFTLNCRMNSAGEEWWLDNMELIEFYPCVPLPIELVEFNGSNNKDHNSIFWVTATETNNHFFTLERSVDGMGWSTIEIKDGSGTISTPSFYKYNDYEYTRGITNYYRLSQTDFDGTTKYFNIIAVESEKIVKCELYEYYNLSGLKIDIETVPPGLYLRKCNNKVEKIVKLE